MSEDLIQKAIARYFAALGAADANAWADCFASTVRFEDPIGAGVLTERDAIIERGQSLIAAFESLRFEVDYTSISGARAALKWTGRGVLKDGLRVRFAGIDTFEFNDIGQIIALTGYWNPLEMMPE